MLFHRWEKFLPGSDGELIKLLLVFSVPERFTDIAGDMTPFIFPQTHSRGLHQVFGEGSAGLKKWLLEDPTSGNRILHHATQTKEPSLGCQKISVITSSWISGCLTLQIAILLVIRCGVHLIKWPTKFCATPKINERQG